MASGTRATAIFFRKSRPPGLVPSCAETGVVGALTGVIGTLMAMEAIKMITGTGEPLIGRLLLYDALSARFDTIKLQAAENAEPLTRSMMRSAIGTSCWH
jgi:molybdopterin/thiamine biosynthesis adenylyltransferase